MARYISSASAPPCALGTYSKDRSEALVAMVGGGEHIGMLRELARALLFASAADNHMSAVVADLAKSCAFVVVVGAVRTIIPAAAALKKQIEQLPGEPKVEWCSRSTAGCRRA